MTEHTTILTPIRYPLTAQSTQTLARAEQLASNVDAEQVHLLVLYVNLLHHHDDVQQAEIRQAITPLLDEVPVSVLTRRGFLVEEVILEEARQFEVDCIVIGKNQRARWRRLLTWLLQSEVELASFLQKNTRPDVAVEVVG